MSGSVGMEVILNITIHDCYLSQLQLLTKVRIIVCLAERLNSYIWGSQPQVLSDPGFSHFAKDCVRHVPSCLLLAPATPLPGPPYCCTRQFAVACQLAASSHTASSHSQLLLTVSLFAVNSAVSQAACCLRPALTRHKLYRCGST